MLGRMMLQVALANPAITLDSLRATCEEVLEAGKEQEQLIEALLTLARSQRGLDHREPLDLTEITGRVLHAHEPGTAARKLRVDAALSPAPITGDSRLVEMLVSNLLENAIRHNIPDGHIQVAVGTHRTQATLTVSNTGIHIPADQVERLLQPFQHLDGKRSSDHEGLGLGLSIVAAIADAHDATLSVHPQPHGGLAIRVSFHLAVDSASSRVHTTGGTGHPSLRSVTLTFAPQTDPSIDAPAAPGSQTGSQQPQAPGHSRRPSAAITAGS
jgi:signal transduction histidine kinase